MNSYYLNLRKKIGQDLIVYPSVAACIKNEKNEILLVRKKGSNIWGFPAGGVEPNETIEEALKREVKEETNKDVIPEKLIAIYSSPNFDFNYDDYWNGKLHSCPDSQNATTLHVLCLMQPTSPNSKTCCLLI